MHVVYVSSEAVPFAKTGGLADVAGSLPGALAKQGIDGVYDVDPKGNADARRYEHLGFDEAIAKNLRVMDQTALALCRENRLPIIVFDSSVQGNILKVASGEKIGTTVGE